MANKKSFVFYHEWGEILKKLPVEEVGNITLALIAYSECGVIPTLSPIADIAFTAFKQTVDRDFEKWESTCQIRAENGREGGRPKKPNGFSDNQNKPNGFLAFSEKPKKADNEYDNDNDIEYESDKDIANSSPPPPSKPHKKKYGEYENVLLTDEELQRLKEEIPNTAEMIERLSSYVASKGAKYKSHYATIRNWHKRETEIKLQQQNKTGKPDYSVSFSDLLKQ